MDLSSDLEAVFAQANVPGCSVAVLEDGEIVLERGFGLPPTSRMPACSMSKPVAVVAALRLVEQGLLDLDADVSDYLTRWTIPANGDWRPRITIRQLASHTAGLTAHTGFPGYPRGEEVPTLVEVLSGVHPANAPGARVDLVPGVQYRYSGAGTSILQLAMEEVTGRAAGELLSELVLEPLGMWASSLVQDVEDKDRASGHLAGGRPVPGGWRVQPELCAAGLWTTPSDYLRFLNGVQRALAGDLDAILSQTTAQELLTPVAALPSGPDMTGMRHSGLGFFLTICDGATTWFGHTGSNTGFVCASIGSVSGQRGAVVMVNSDAGTPAVKLVLQSIVRSRRWIDIDLDLSPPRELPGGVGAHAGTYRSDDGLTVVLADDAGAITLTLDGQPPIPMTFVDPTALGTETVDLRVHLEADGSISLEQGGQRATLHR